MIESRKHYLMLLGLLLSATMLAGSASAQPLSPSALPIPTGVVTLVLWLLMVGFGLRTGQSWGQSLDRRWGHYPRFSLLLGGIGLLVSAVIGFAMLRSF